MSRRPVRVLSIGWFGERNLGDEAMLDGLRSLLELAFGEVEMTVMSADPVTTERLHGVRAIPLPPPEQAGFRNPAMIRAAWRTDLVTLGGGDLIREAHGALAPARYWLRRLRVAHALRRPVAGLGLSVGDLRDPAVIDETRDHLARFALLVVRDEGSAERVEALGLARPPVMGDLAFEAPGIDTDGRAAPATGGSATGPRIGVCVRELARRGPEITAEIGDHLRATLAVTLDRVVEERGASIELIPFRTRPRRGLRDDDEAAGEALASAARTGATWRRHAVPETTKAFAAIADGLDAVVSVRLHGLVLAAAAGVPVAAVAYDPKVNGILAELGIPRQGVPLDADAPTLYAAVVRALDEPNLRDRERDGVHAARARTAAIVPRLAAVLHEPPA